MSLRDDFNEVGKDIKNLIKDFKPSSQNGDAEGHETEHTTFQQRIIKVLHTFASTLRFIALYIGRLIIYFFHAIRYLRQNWYEPYHWDIMFPYRFKQLFFFKPYWREVGKILFPPVEGDPQRPYYKWLFLLCLIYSPSALFALWMFRVAYRQLKLKEQRIPPDLTNQPRLVYVAMLFGSMIPLYLAIIFLLINPTIVLIPIAAIVHFPQVFFEQLKMIDFSATLKLLFHFLTGQGGNGKYLFNLLGMLLLGISCLIGMGIGWVTWSYLMFLIVKQGFKTNQDQFDKYWFNVDKHGSARFANHDELESAAPSEKEPEGFYIGGERYYDKRGHLITVAGTRAGKGTNLIIPNLLKIGRFKGSFVVIDPKGELAAVTARAQEKLGRKVIILNPWDLLVEGAPHLQGMCYNPLDLLSDPKDDNFVDDAQVIAEMIVPINHKVNKDDFFDNRARAFIAGFIMQIVSEEPVERRNLRTLYEVTRLPEEKFIEFLADMAASDLDAVRGIAAEIKSLRASDKTFSSVMGSIYDYTHFLNSPRLQQSMERSDFNIRDLTKGNIALYVIIPADKIPIHFKWLRLVVITAMRSVIRNPNKDVCFLLDEFFALGYISEIEVALSTYAGYGVHVWAILQNLIQLKSLYGEQWESFISSCSVRHFFNISDNFSTKYLSEMFGTTTQIIHNGLGEVKEANARHLINPDELRKASGDVIFTVIDQLSPAAFMKQSYLMRGDLVRGEDYDDNPYHKDSIKALSAHVDAPVNEPASPDSSP